eukprot:1187387-Prorocentrum_minimum.AAC.1
MVMGARQKYADAEELRAHPHHSFTLEGDLLIRLSTLATLQVRALPVCICTLATLGGALWPRLWQVCKPGKLGHMRNCSAEALSSADGGSDSGEEGHARTALAARWAENDDAPIVERHVDKPA